MLGFPRKSPLPASLLALGLLAGCLGASSRTSPLVDHLANKGPVALSPDNPFIASNQLVARFAEQSSEISGFLKVRGSPPVIEVTKGSFSPMGLAFFYPSARERYELEEQNGVWLIGGPFAIADDKLASLHSLAMRVGESHRDTPFSPPLITVTTQSTITGFSSPINPPEPTRTPTAVLSILPPSTLSPAPSPRATISPPRVVTPVPPISSPAPEQTASSMLRDTSPKTEEVEGFTSPPPPLPTNAERTLGSLLGRTAPALPTPAGGGSPAETSPKGDVVHYVTMPGETLSIIARWYTEDRENAGKIARMNSLKDPNSLTVGDSIVIPSYLVKRKVRLTADTLEHLQKVAEREKAQK